MKELKESFFRKIKKIFLCGVLFFVIVGFVLAILHPQNLILVGKLILTPLPELRTSFWAIVIVCIIVIFVVGIPIYFGGDTILRKIPIFKHIKEGLKIIENGEVVEATLSIGLRYYGIAQRGWKFLADDEWVDIYRPHSTMITGETVAVQRKFVSESKLTKKQFLLFVTTGGQLRFPQD